MPRTKAISTRVRELSQGLTPEQMREMAEALRLEADKPRLDKREYGKWVRAVKASYIRLMEAEEKISELLTAAGKTNDEINGDLNDIRREAERAKSAAPAATPRRRGRAKAKEA